MIRETDNKIEINLDEIIKNYYVNSNFEYFFCILLSIFSDKKVNKEVHLVANNETPINWPFGTVVNTIIDLIDLPANQIILHTVDKGYKNDKCTVIYATHTGCSSMPDICKNLEWKINDDAVLFGALFGRPSFPRISLAYHLETYYSSQSVVTLLSSKQHFEHNILGLEEYFENEIKWFEKRKNLSQASTAENHLGTLNFPENIIQWPAIWGKYHIEIIVETNYFGLSDFTEKTVKCLVTGKPFILIKANGSFDYLRECGFKTFAPYINEEYANKSTIWERVQSAKKEIDRIATFSEKEKLDFLTQIYQIANENKEICQKGLHSGVF